VYDFELRKIVPQARGKPLWRLPKSKAVMECDEKFHSTSFEFQVSSFK
jgi:hypothetical protein